MHGGKPGEEYIHKCLKLIVRALLLPHMAYFTKESPKYYIIQLYDDEYNDQQWECAMRIDFLVAD